MVSYNITQEGLIVFESIETGSQRVDKGSIPFELIEIDDIPTWVKLTEEKLIDSAKTLYSPEELRALSKSELECVLKHDECLEGEKELWGAKWITAQAGLWICQLCGHPVHGEGKPDRCESQACRGRKGAWKSNPAPMYAFPTIDFPQKDLLVNLYTDIHEIIQNYLSLPAPVYQEILTLWILGTWKFHNFRTYPYLFFTGEIGSGKSTALEILEQLCYRPKNLVNPSPSVVSRLCHEANVTILLDEAQDTFNLKSERGIEMYDLFMSGYKKGQKYVRAKQGKDEGCVEREVFTPKAYAATKSFDPAIQSRSIGVFMTTEQPAERIDERAEKHFRDLRAKLLWWHFAREDFADFKIELNCRAWELWYPLCQIAHLVDVDIKPLIEIGLENQRLVEEELSQSAKGVMVDVLLSFLEGIQETEMVSIGELSSAYPGGLTPQKTGYLLKDLGIQKRKRSNGRYVIFDQATKYDLQRLKKAYRL